MLDFPSIAKPNQTAKPPGASVAPFLCLPLLPLAGRIMEAVTAWRRAGVLELDGSLQADDL